MENVSKYEDKIETLEKDLSEQREEIRSVTINKNNIIEEHIKRIKVLEDQFSQMSAENAEMANLNEKIVELSTHLENSREQKLNDDMSLAKINDTVKILQSQLSERDSEIAQLGILIQQKEDDLNKATDGIQKVLGECHNCEAEKLHLQDQLDR